MRRGRPGLLLGTLLLSACVAAQRDQCLRAAVEEVRTLDHLIAETEAGLARGYGIDRQTLPYLEERRCADGAGTCLYTETEEIARPKTIDPGSENRRLAALRKKRAAAVPRAMAHIAECRARYGQSGRP